MGAQGIDVGDAVFTFLGDSTKLDQKFAEIGPKAEAAFQPATKAVEDFGKSAEDAGSTTSDAMGEVRTSTRDARGEAALLGEAFGIHLPRHVRTFLAELPGVDKALSAAFSATAVLFLVKALAEGADKLSNWIANTFIFTEAMRESNKMWTAQGNEIVKQLALFHDYQKQLQDLDDDRTPLEKLKAALKANEDEMDRLAFKTGEYARTSTNTDVARVLVLQEQNQLLQKQIELEREAEAKKSDKEKLQGGEAALARQKELGLAMLQLQEQQAKALIAGMAGNGAAEFAIEETFQQKRYELDQRYAQARLELEKKYGHDNEETIKNISAEIVKTQESEVARLLEVQNKLKDETTKDLAELSKEFTEAGPVQIVPPKAVQQILEMDAAARQLGITLKGQLVEAYNAAAKAAQTLIDSGKASDEEIAMAKEKVAELDNQIKNFGIDQDKFKAHTEATWNNLITEWGSRAPQALANLKNMASSTFNSISNGLQSAVSTAILAEGSFSKAIERATAQALASLAAQALVKGLFYTAEGFAALATFDAASASQFFEAAALMDIVGGSAGIAARAMSGSGGGSGSNLNATGGKGYYAMNNSTSSSGGPISSSASRVGVQAFADGGLVTRPTLALIGEAGPEMVVPLSKGGSPSGQAHVHHHTHNHWNVHVKGLMDSENLSKTMRKMSELISKGQGTLNASSTFKITRRGG